MGRSNKNGKLLACADVKGLLRGLLRRELPPNLAGRVEAHLLWCQECADAWGALLDDAVEMGEINAPEITSIPPAPSSDDRRSLREPGEQSGVLGVFWKTLARKAFQGEQSARHKLESLREDLSDLAAGWQPAFIRVSGPGEPVTVKAHFFDRTSGLEGERLDLELFRPASITPDGRLDAKVITDDSRLLGKILSLTLVSKGQKLVTFAGVFRPGDRGRAEAVFSEEGLGLPPSIITADDFVLHVWRD